MQRTLYRTYVYLRWGPYKLLDTDTPQSDIPHLFALSPAPPVELFPEPPRVPQVPRVGEAWSERAYSERDYNPRDAEYAAREIARLRFEQHFGVNRSFAPRSEDWLSYHSTRRDAEVYGLTEALYWSGGLPRELLARSSSSSSAPEITDPFELLGRDIPASATGSGASSSQPASSGDRRQGGFDERGPLSFHGWLAQPDTEDEWDPFHSQYWKQAPEGCQLSAYCNWADRRIDSAGEALIYQRLAQDQVREVRLEELADIAARAYSEAAQTSVNLLQRVARLYGQFPVEGPPRLAYTDLPRPPLTGPTRRILVWDSGP